MSGLLETYSNYSTKFSSPMACYVHDYIMGNGDNGDEDWCDEVNMEGMARFGRRVLAWRSDGFVDLSTFATEDEASEYLQACEPMWEDEDEDEDAPNPYAQPGGLLDEIQQAERLIGSE